MKKHLDIAPRKSSEPLRPAREPLAKPEEIMEEPAKKMTAEPASEKPLKSADPSTGSTNSIAVNALLVVVIVLMLGLVFFLLSSQS